MKRIKSKAAFFFPRLLEMTQGGSEYPQVGRVPYGARRARKRCEGGDSVPLKALTTLADKRTVELFFLRTL
jgi:hypothetical protein